MLSKSPIQGFLAIVNSGATHQHTSLQISAVFGRSADKHRPVACIPRVTIKVQILKGRETIQEGVRIQEAEQWKDVPGWENLYMVSNTGKVWSQITGKIKKLPSIQMDMK